MKERTFVALTLIAAWAFPQKESTKTIDATDIQSIELDASSVFQVNVSTHESQEIIIAMHTEGEFANDLFITQKHQGNSLRIGTAFQPAFKDHNDKLSAHKVISLSMEIKVPNDKLFTIESDIANVTFYGSVPVLKAYLQSGFCVLKDFYGNADIITQKGPIELMTRSGIVHAESKNGKVVVDALSLGNNKISLKTIDGDIRVIRTQ